MTTDTKVLVSNCPFCGSNPRIEDGKKAYCQLHGDPSQPVVIRCADGSCPSNPCVKGGNIFNGGRPKAVGEAIRRWNTRVTSAIEAELRNALWDMLQGWTYVRKQHGDLYGVGWDRCQQAAEAAIANHETPAAIRNMADVHKKALEDIAGGWINDAGTMVVNGDWKGLFGAAQRMAANALAAAPSPSHPKSKASE